MISERGGYICTEMCRINTRSNNSRMYANDIHDVYINNRNWKTEPVTLVLLIPVLCFEKWFVHFTVHLVVVMFSLFGYLLHSREINAEKFSQSSNISCLVMLRQSTYCGVLGFGRLLRSRGLEFIIRLNTRTSRVTGYRQLAPQTGCRSPAYLGSAHCLVA